MKAFAIGLAGGLAVMLGLPILLVILLGGASPAAAAATAAGAAACDDASATASPDPTPTATPRLDADAVAAAQAIVSTAQRLNVLPAGDVVALDVALARTDLHADVNEPAGRVGVFAMTPSATATATELQDTSRAAELFFEKLNATPDWTFLPVTEAANDALPELATGSYAAALPEAQQLAAELLASFPVSAPTSTTSPAPTAAPPSAPPSQCEPGSATTIDGSGIDAMLAFARAQVGKPYVLGANGPDAWDCSSLVQAAFNAAGVHLPRVAVSQYEWVRDHGTVFPGPPGLDELFPGDLLFSVGDDPDRADDGQRVGHVAIYAGGGVVIEAMGAKWGVIESTYTTGHWGYVTWVGRVPTATISPPSTSPAPSK